MTAEYRLEIVHGTSLHNTAINAVNGQSVQERLQRSTPNAVWGATERCDFTTHASPTDIMLR